MPFGKYKGVRIRLLPDNYLSWLASSGIMHSPQWNWLKESLTAELKFRGLKWELAYTQEPEIDIPEKPKPPRRRIEL